MFRPVFIIFFLLFLFSLGIYAQQQSYVFQHLTSKDGLASDNVTCIFQDSKGFYWLGSENGLQKFDGKNFSNAPFGKKYRNGSIITDPVFYPISEDKQGNIWVHHINFISVYHPLTQRISHIEIRDDSMHPTLSNIKNFCKDASGNMWIVTAENIYKYDNNKNASVLWLSIGQSTNKANATYLLYDDNKKALWLARNREILSIDILTKKIEKPFFEIPEKVKIADGHAINVFWMDSKQNLWFSDWKGLLYKYNTSSYEKEVYGKLYNNSKSKTTNKKPQITCFIEDSHGTVWIASHYGGLSYYDEKRNSITSIAVNNNLPSFHYNYFVNSLYRDAEGNIWAGTDKGINVFNPSFQQFTTIDENNVLNPFTKTEVTKIVETTSGNILVGTWGNGWFIYDQDFRLKKHFYHTSTPYANNQQNKKNLVWSFAEDGNGKIWIGYQYGLIGIYDTVTQHLQYINVPEFEGKTVMDIKCDAKGNMWFGLYSGFLGKWDITKKKFIIYKNLLRLPPEEYASVSSILINKQNEIWVATNGNGFYCFDAVHEKVTERYANREPDSTLDNTVASLTQINDSIIGVATYSKGFLWFNQKKRSFSSFTINDGLPTNYVYGLGQDKQKNLWIATTDGLLRLNKDKHKLVSFDEEDGLLNKQFIGDIQLLSNGRMAIPTSTGLVYFLPGNINDLPAPPDAQITGFKVFDQSLSIDSILSGNKTVELDHQQNFITIGYASLSFLGRSTIQYFYQLENVDRSWVEAGQQRFASYTNLSPGHYKFKLKCKNRDGISSKGITTLSIYICPPWWATWWAYTLYALLIGSIIYSLYRNHINNLKKKQSDQIATMVATQEEERKRISRDLHDDVGTKLSALKLFLSSLREKALETNNEEINSLAQSSEDFISEAMRDVRQLLHNLSPGVLEEFGYTTAVEGLVNKINETKQLQFSLVVFGMKQRLQKDYELALYRITQELINNVLKHSEAKHVSLQIGERDEKIILMIEDDGKGFDLSSHNNGYGLYNLEARTKLLHGVITIDSQFGKGTSVLIEIPYHLNKV
jgi:signal transduction histidine kinase/ligand-binding sensor domain-containing protein